MNFSINTKFQIGDKVRCFEEHLIGDKEICPICNGNYKVPNPNFGHNDDNEEFLYCKCCNKGRISVNQHKEIVLIDYLYIITDIKINISKDEIEYIYCLYASPELNNFKSGCTYKEVGENDLQIVESVTKQNFVESLLLVGEDVKEWKEYKKLKAQKLLKRKAWVIEPGCTHPTDCTDDCEFCDWNEDVIDLTIVDFDKFNEKIHYSSREDAKEALKQMKGKKKNEG